MLRRARAVMICPQVFRAGFLFGGQGGTCVLTARDAAGSWSSPAFYALGGASFGFQAGHAGRRSHVPDHERPRPAGDHGHAAEARRGCGGDVRRSRRRRRRRDHGGALGRHRRLQPGARPVRRHLARRQHDERQVRLERRPITGAQSGCSRSSSRCRRTTRAPIRCARCCPATAPRLRISAAAASGSLPPAPAPMSSCAARGGAAAELAAAAAVGAYPAITWVIRAS